MQNYIWFLIGLSVWPVSLILAWFTVKLADFITGVMINEKNS